MRGKRANAESQKCRNIDDIFWGLNMSLMVSFAQDNGHTGICELLSLGTEQDLVKMLPTLQVRWQK